jgi:hypothetical protein
LSSHILSPFVFGFFFTANDRKYWQTEYLLHVQVYIMIEYPPSTIKLVPVKKSEALLAKNMAAPANSSGSPHLPAGVLTITRSSRPWISLLPRCVISVLIQPGRIAFTWMLSGAQAQARHLVS